MPGGRRLEVCDEAECGRSTHPRIRSNLSAFCLVFDYVTLSMNTEPRLDEGVLMETMWLGLMPGLGVNAWIN